MVIIHKRPSGCLLLWILACCAKVFGADDDYNILQTDGSYQFGYNTPDSFHHSQANRNNVVRGEFGGRNPKTGGIDAVSYTAGPRGFRPRGKNVVRNFDQSQTPRRPIGSPDDPYFDPNEDPSYSFGFRTPTYNRQEATNRVGDVNGRFSFVDDVGERHNVEYIAGRNTGFHVKTPFPDSNPRAYGPLYFRGRGRPIPRGRTSIQRGLDGSYRFVSAGPDQRRTEISDASGNVRGSYTYLDDKGVQHSVHYIAGPQIGYRVLKNVKGPHLPDVFPFAHPNIIPGDFYDFDKGSGDVFDTAASGRPGSGGAGRPSTGGTGGTGSFAGPGTGSPSFGGDGGAGGAGGSGGDFGSKPTSGTSVSGGGKPSYSDSGEYDGDFSDLFGGGSGTAGAGGRPGSAGKPGGAAGSSDSDFGSSTSKEVGQSDMFGGKPTQSTGGGGTTTTTGGTGGRPTTGAGVGGGTGGSTGPGAASGTGGARPGVGTSKPSYDDDDYGDFGLFDDDSTKRPSVSIGGGGGGSSSGGGRPPTAIGPGETPTAFGGPLYFTGDRPTIVTNLGDRYFSIPPGVSIPARVQSIDLYPYESKVPPPGDAYKSEGSNIVTRKTKFREPFRESRKVQQRSTIAKRDEGVQMVQTTTQNSMTTTLSSSDVPDSTNMTKT